MSVSGSTVSAAIATPAPTPPPTTLAVTPQLLWPSVVRSGAGWSPSDGSAFPTAMEITQRYKLGHAKVWLPAFLVAIATAQTRVLIADNYLFDEPGGVDAVLGWFPDSIAASDIRLASGAPKAISLKIVRTKVQALQNRINALRSNTTVKAKVQLKLTLDKSTPPFLHDRFALVDEELWHFGATVGGLHAGVNAVSRGWTNAATRAYGFFGEVWAQPAGKSGTTS